MAENNSNKNKNTFISKLSWVGAIAIGYYGYTLEGTWNGALWYGLAGFAIGSLAAYIIRIGILWIVVTIFLVGAIIIFKERIERVFGIDLDPIFEPIMNLFQ